MTYYKPDVYYQPEKFDLEKVAEVDDPEAFYSFDLLVVWRQVFEAEKTELLAKVFNLFPTSVTRPEEDD